MVILPLPYAVKALPTALVLPWKNRAEPQLTTSTSMTKSELPNEENVAPKLLPCLNDVQQLMAMYGIAENYIEYSGHCREIPFASRLKTLSLMGAALDSCDNIKRALQEHRFQTYGRALPATWVITSSEAIGIPLTLPRTCEDELIEWTLILENGEKLSDKFNLNVLPVIKQNTLDETVFTQRHLPLPKVIPGYHCLSVDILDEQLTSNLIVSPPHCYKPDWVIQGKKLGGISVQVYSLRSKRNWGIGDFSDLSMLITHLAKQQLDFLVLNPLHLLDANNPEHCSPYSPMDRRFINPIYIDPEREPDFFENKTLQQKLQRNNFQKQLENLRKLDLIEYKKVTKIKYSVFSSMFRYFRKYHLNAKTERGYKFIKFIADKGKVGNQFALYQAKHTRFSLWHIRDPHFHLYLQWIAESQLEACQQATIQHGMRLGLIRDLAVGSHTHSIEVQLNKSLFSMQASVGAPPDPLAPQGQNWGLPPLNPIALKASGYRHFIELLRDNMVHCGALRIDHVMALMRLWWCPGTADDGDGAYVRYPVEDLFAILRLESTRNHCVVIGEDLGVVPPEIRQFMHDSHVFSNALFYFEKYDEIHFKKPEHFGYSTLTMVANHDVPTLKAWWQKLDLQTRFDIGLMDKGQLQSAISQRESDLIQILHWLNELGLLPENWHDFNIHHPFDSNLAGALLRANGISQSRLVSVQLDDICLLETPVNIPGTSAEYPNWRRKLNINIEDLFVSQQAISLLSGFVSARSR